MAVRTIELRYLRPGNSDEEQIVPLFSGADAVPAKGSTESSPSPGDVRPIHAQWDLSALAGLLPGDVLNVRLLAEDYKPQLATTTIRRLTIITQEELESRIASRRARS